jgi:hypothetical protein
VKRLKFGVVSGRPVSVCRCEAEVRGRKHTRLRDVVSPGGPLAAPRSGGLSAQNLGRRFGQAKGPENHKGLSAGDRHDE